MDNIIKEISSEAFSMTDLYNLCSGKTKILKYGQLKKFKTLDELLKPHDNVIILYETRKNYGHWVCVIKNSYGVEFFCSYGIFCDDHLKYIPLKFREKTNQMYPILTNLILNSGYKITVNNFNLQRFKNNISTCGRHVGLRIILKDINLNEYINLFKNSALSPDNIVAYLTAFIK